MSKSVAGTHLQDTRGRVNRRFNAKRGTYRLRFTSVHPDQLQTIEQALALARGEAGTQYDTVALEGICLSYLATGPRNLGISYAANPGNGAGK